MPSRATFQTSDDGHLAELFAELTQIVRSETPDGVEAFLAAHPAEADELRRLLPVLSLLDDSFARRLPDSASGDRSSSLVGGDASVDPGPAIAGELGDFQILREIGRGGMGIVYEAQQISLRRRVALKVLPFAAVLDLQQLTRFHNEAQAAAGLHHTNIVPVYSVGCKRGVHYYAMQYIDGITLAQLVAAMGRIQDSGFGIQGEEPWIEQNSHPPLARGGQGGSGGRIEPPERRGTPQALPETGPIAALSTAHTRNPRAYFRKIAELGVQAAEALDYAHQQGIVHRDIKPANLLLDAQGKLWITDFGLARIGTGTNLTITGDLLGTLRYMSPEQVTGSQTVIDHRSDVYSLGATLYELLTLRPVWPGTDRQFLAHQISDDEPDPLHKLAPHIPPDIETIILKSLEKHPEDRYPTAQDLADDLRRFLDDHPIRAKRPTLAQRAGKWSRRHSTIVWSMVAFLAVSTLTLSISMALVLQAYQRESDARRQASIAFENEQASARRESAAAELAREGQRQAIEQRDIARYNLYVSDMHLAQQAWKSGQMARMMELLHSHVPQPDEKDLRGWEWRYLMALSRRDLGTIDARGEMIWSISWSPDGRFLATAAKEVQLLDATTQRLESALPYSETEVPPDRKTLVKRVAWSPDGSMLATSDGNRLTVWDPRENRAIHSFAAPDASVIAWRPDSHQIAVGNWHGQLTIWPFVENAMPAELHGKASVVASLAWSPDGKWLALGDSFHGWLDLWDPLTPKLVQSLKAHDLHILGLAWSPDSRFLASAGGDRQLKFWDSATWNVIVEQRAHEGAISALAWSPDGRWLASGSHDTTVQIWEAATHHPVNTVRGHSAHIEALAWSPAGDRIASSSGDKTVKLWAAFERQDARLVDGIAPVTWSPDGRLLVMASRREGLAQVIDSVTGQLTRELDAGGAEFTALDWRSDPSVIAACSFGGQAVAWDATSGRKLWKAVAPDLGPTSDYVCYFGEARSFGWSPDGRLLATGTANGRIKVWDPATGVLVATPSIDKYPIGAITWSPDGRFLAAKDFGENVAIWLSSTWSEVWRVRCHPYATFGQTGPKALAWSPDGSYLAAGCVDGAIVVWETDTRREVLSILGHASNVLSLDWTADGSRFASGSEDRLVKIWDAATGREMLSLEGHEEPISSIAWSPDGRRLASSGKPRKDSETVPGAIRIWDASGGYAADR